MKASINMRDAQRNPIDKTRYFVLDEEQYSAFELALEAPVGENLALRKLLDKRPPWEN